MLFFGRQLRTAKLILVAFLVSSSILSLSSNAQESPTPSEDIDTATNDQSATQDASKTQAKQTDGSTVTIKTSIDSQDLNTATINGEERLVYLSSMAYGVATYLYDPEDGELTCPTLNYACSNGLVPVNGKDCAYCRNEDKKSKTNIGVVLGAVFGSIGGILVIAIVTFYLIKQRRQSKGTVQDVYPSSAQMGHRQSSLYSSYYSQSQHRGSHPSHLIEGSRGSYTGSRRSGSIYSYQESRITGSVADDATISDSRSSLDSQSIRSRPTSRGSVVSGVVGTSATGPVTHRPEVVDVSASGNPLARADDSQQHRAHE
ncbi:hypothetical protein H4219_000799 [Mycoemilia scoparia]|uniref:Uncharacterized protein n=1 Tax=Mycoemilia scoparia TaxID=417184 RepID=A0A9W8AB47_9FUNG|nr:hypothetical protein H4219_000799 [Mycoemilia scoparia]